MRTSGIRSHHASYLKNNTKLVLTSAEVKILIDKRFESISTHFRPLFSRLPTHIYLFLIWNLQFLLGDLHEPLPRQSHIGNPLDSIPYKHLTARRSTDLPS